MTNKQTVSSRPGIMQLILPYWTSKQSLKGWIFLIIQLLMVFTVVYISVWVNSLAGQVVDALVKRQWDGLWQLLATMMAAGLLDVVLTMISAYLLYEALRYQWRSWLTEWLLSAWVRHCNYYNIERDASLDNTDQRIAEDVEKFVVSTLSLTIPTLKVVATAVAFCVVLWNLSAPLSFDFLGSTWTVYGYLLYVAFAFALGSLLISHFMGRQLIGLINRKQTVEANFRYKSMQLRENAEQIAFYKGGEQEYQQLVSYFSDIKENWRAIIYRTCKMTLARDVYLHTGTVVPTLAALPQYLSGNISLGGLTQVTGAFERVTSSLLFFTQAYIGFTEWMAVSNRLRDLLAVMQHTDEANQHQKKIFVRDVAVDVISSSALCLRQPNGELILECPALQMKMGERWLIRGRSGSGKSTLLRAIAGLWPYGEGEIFIPQHKKMLFLPQRSYIPVGSLKAALCYPQSSAHFDDQQCIAVLKQVHLQQLVDQLEHSDRWQQKLSGGEQQRLAFARVLLQKADFVFLDEATSALDSKLELAMYQALFVALPNAAIISIAHRESLAALHQQVLDVGSALNAVDQASVDRLP